MPADADWSDFRVLLALAREGSAAGAARALRIDNSTVSRRLAALEEAMGVRLVVRGGREFGLTAEGRVALASAQAIESAVNDATRTIRAARLEVAGAVRVSCPSGMIPALARMLPAVSQNWPKLVIEFGGDNRTVDLARGDADVAVRMFRPTEAGFVARRTFEVGWGVFAARSYLAERGCPKCPEDLRDHSLVLYVEAMHRVEPMRWLEDWRGERSAAARLDNTEVAVQVTRAGAGIAVLPCFVAAPFEDLVRVFPEPVASNTGWIVYHEAMRDTARVRATVEALANWFESNVQQFSGRP